MDFSEMKELTDIKNLISESAEYIRSQPEHSLITLTNLKNMHFNSEIKELFSDFIKKNKPHIKSSAVIGLSGLQQFVYNGIMKITGRNIRSFENINTAKDWLTSK
ncbi:MAG: hypothetical protein GXO47_10570 [Chlorobi bacterium]|nr:hypothetical protein [Chlorobiota bacterium]